MLNQLFYQSGALFGLWFSTGSEDPVATQRYNIFQTFERIAAHIESPVKGNAHTFGRLHQFAVSLHVHVAMRSKTTYHHAIGVQFFGYFDIVEHNLVFR